MTKDQIAALKLITPRSRPKWQDAQELIKILPDLIAERERMIAALKDLRDLHLRWRNFMEWTDKDTLGLNAVAELIAEAEG